jgi:hypothetical protein
MAFNEKTAKENPAFDAACEMFHQSVQTVAAMQKNVLDLAVQQNSEAIQACKKNLKGTFFANSAPLFDLAAQALEKYAGLQKSLIDLAVEQTNALGALPELRHETPAKAASAVTNLAQQAWQRGLAAQKLALDVAAQQNRAVAETVKQQLSGTPVAAAADSIQRGVDALIETQRNVLEIAGKPVKPAAATA